MQTIVVSSPKVATHGAIDLTAPKSRQQSAWASGDYAVIGSTLQIVGETL